MNHFRNISRVDGRDIGYASQNIHPENGEGRVGKHGIDKTYTLDQMIQLAHSMSEKPDVLIKNGPNGKWYMKKYNSSLVRNADRCTMWIIKWDT